MYKVWVCIKKPLLIILSGACETCLSVCDYIWFSSLSQQKHLNPTHLTLTQKRWCDVTCMCELVHVYATANMRFGLFNLGPVFYFVGEWGSTQKEWLGSELYPSFAFLPLTKAGRTQDKRSNYYPVKAEKHKHTSHTHTNVPTWTWTQANIRSHWYTRRATHMYCRHTDSVNIF